MKKIDRLKKEAIESCVFRGHKMRRFIINGVGYYSSSCKNCGALVFVVEKPLPNEIEIAGEAVALNCK